RRKTFPACCACAASGAARRALATLPMNVRRSTTESLRRRLEVRPYYASMEVLPPSATHPPVVRQASSMSAMEHNALRPVMAGGGHGFRAEADPLNFRSGGGLCRSDQPRASITRRCVVVPGHWLTGDCASDVPQFHRPHRRGRINDRVADL